MTKTLVVQMGHVPRTSGSTGTEGEQVMARTVAAIVRATAPAGWAVRVINADEPDGRYRGHAFVAIHGDGSTNRNVHGASVGYRTPEGKALAQAWKRAYKSAGWPGLFHDDNYTKNLSGYYGVRKAVEVGNKAAFILEVGTMTNRADRHWIDHNHRKIAASVWAAVAPSMRRRITVSTVIRLRPGGLVIARVNPGDLVTQLGAPFKATVGGNVYTFVKVRRRLLVGYTLAKYLREE